MNTLSVNPKLVNPAAGQLWVLQSEAGNPFSSHEGVTVKDVKNGFVQYQTSCKGRYIHSHKIDVFRSVYQLKRGAS